jgi:hypothetical protein
MLQTWHYLGLGLLLTRAGSHEVYEGFAGRGRRLSACGPPAAP